MYYDYYYYYYYYYEAICAYADDVVTVTRLRQVYREIEEKTQRTGLIVNEKKTKYMIVLATQDGRQTQNWKAGDKVFERVSSFKYLGNVKNTEGKISECVEDNTRREQCMQLTIIRPVVMYGSETWPLTKCDENLLRIFDWKILRKIYGPIQEGNIWKIRNNEELQRDINGENIVKFVKAQRIRWLGYVKRMEVGAMLRKVMEGKLLTGRRKGRPI
jgi:hypothetical protein